MVEYLLRVSAGGWGWTPAISQRDDEAEQKDQITFIRHYAVTAAERIHGAQIKNVNKRTTEILNMNQCRSSIIINVEVNIGYSRG